MTKPILIPATVFAMTLTAACGGGDSSDTDDDPVIINGLPVGAEGQHLSDAEGINVTARTERLVAGNTPGTQTAVIRVNNGFFAGDLDGRIELFGETVTIRDGSGTLGSGEQVQLTYEADRSGTYVAALEASILGDPASDETVAEAVYIFGFETDPAEMAALPAGTLRYIGGFQAAGYLNDDPTDPVPYDGEMTVVVDLGNDTADVTLDGIIDNTTDTDMSGTVGLSSNDLSGTLRCDGCSGSAALRATFYGPDAAELGGVLGLTNVGDDGFDGTGTFIIPEEGSR